MDSHSKNRTLSASEEEIEEPVTSGSDKEFIRSSSSEDSLEKYSNLKSKKKLTSKSKSHQKSYLESRRTRIIHKKNQDPKTLRYSSSNNVSSKNSMKNETVTEMVQRMRKAVHAMDNDLSNLSKSAATLEFDFSVLNKLHAGNSSKIVYTVNNLPILPNATGRVISHEQFNVGIPIKNANDVIEFNDILKNERVFDEIVCILNMHLLKYCSFFYLNI